MQVASDGDWKRLRALWMQLRKCCNHPYLFKDAEPDFDGETTGRSLRRWVKLLLIISKPVCDHVTLGDCPPASVAAFWDISQLQGEHACIFFQLFLAGQDPAAGHTPPGANGRTFKVSSRPDLKSKKAAPVAVAVAVAGKHRLLLHHALLSQEKMVITYLLMPPSPIP